MWSDRMTQNASFPYRSITIINVCCKKTAGIDVYKRQILLYYDKEIPYSVEVVVEEFKEEPKKIHIRAVINVERDSQKGIIIDVYKRQG